MPVVQNAAELGNDDRLTRCDFREARISLAHFKRQTLRAIGGQGCGWSIRAKSNPVAIALTWKVILETVPIFLRLIEPVDVPNPLQVIGTLSAHQIDDMPVGYDVTCGTFSGAAVPLAIPAKPVSVRLGPPFDQNRRAEIFGVACPCSKILIEFASSDFLERKLPFTMPLIDIRTKHQPNVRNFSEIADPAAHRS